MRSTGLNGRAMMSIDFYIMLNLREVSLFVQIKALITVHHDWQFAFEDWMNQFFYIPLCREMLIIFKF